ncbi:MAG: hypothetical protein PHZ25_01900 [Candidatus Pacebacteria bacterium]|nr:hypothetical protein [Candidatus Paceibacterota bacterium]
MEKNNGLLLSVLKRRLSGLALVAAGSFIFGFLPFGGPFSIIIGMIITAAGLSLITC